MVLVSSFILSNWTCNPMTFDFRELTFIKGPKLLFWNLHPDELWRLTGDDSTFDLECWLYFNFCFPSHSLSFDLWVPNQFTLSFVVNITGIYCGWIVYHQDRNNLTFTLGNSTLICVYRIKITKYVHYLGYKIPPKPNVCLKYINISKYNCLDTKTLIPMT